MRPTGELSRVALKRTPSPTICWLPTVAPRRKSTVDPSPRCALIGECTKRSAPETSNDLGRLVDEITHATMMSVVNDRAAKNRRRK